MVWEGKPAVGTVQLLLMWLVTEAVWWIIKVIICVDAKQPKTFSFKEVECSAIAKSITWPESNWAWISFAEGRMPQEQALLAMIS